MKNKLLTSSFLAVVSTVALGVLPTFAVSTMAPPPPPPPLPGKAAASTSCTSSVLEKKLNEQRKVGNIVLKGSVRDIAEDMAKDGTATPGSLRLHETLFSRNRLRIIYKKNHRLRLHAFLRLVAQ